MVPTPRATQNGSGRSKAQLEIIPDTRFIVFSGSEHEASPVKLTGVVRLTTPDSMSILKPKVWLEGKRKISWWYMGGMAVGEVSDKRSFWTQEQKLSGIESSHKIKAGTIEWPFELELSPSMPESVEGLRETYIAYHLHASVARPGWNSKDIVTQEHIRIVRTLGQDSMEMTRSRVNADIWANKISYSISIPTDAIVFGTSVTADVELSPIKKGLKLGKIELRMMETVVKRIQTSEVPDQRGDRAKSEETEVAKADMEFPEHSRVMYDDETADNPTMADEMYRFKACLPLPKSLNQCRQDVDSHSINVTHRFKLMMNLHNPEGHVSQLVCRLPVKIFISPNLPVDESNQVCPIANGVTEEALNSSETTVVAPPQYGRHQLDQIFSDMDPSGYASRGPSLPGSPSGLNAQSRRASQEMLTSLDGVANGSGNEEPEENPASPSASILQRRLADLQERGSTIGTRSPGFSFSHSPSGGNSPAPGVLESQLAQSPEQLSRSNASQPSSYMSYAQRSVPYGSATVSRRVSTEDLSASVTESDYNMDNLIRVPSYGAALRAPGTVTPLTDGPPSYVEATSRPPSPGIQRPGQVHVRSGAETPNSQGSQQTLTNSSSVSINAQPPGVPRPVRAHRDSAAADDAARVRALRART